jgi:hypothetical protein
MAKNAFAKSRPATQPYAIYRAGDHGLARMQDLQAGPKSETGDMYARWFVWAKSPMTYGDFEGGDTYAQRSPDATVRLVAADLAWLDEYASGVSLPTPAEYLQDVLMHR